MKGLDYVAIILSAGLMIILIFTVVNNGLKEIVYTENGARIMYICLTGAMTILGAYIGSRKDKDNDY